MDPDVGGSNPPIIRRVVVLPQPDGPRRLKNSPSRTSRSIASTAVKPRPGWAPSTYLETRRPTASPPKVFVSLFSRTATSATGEVDPPGTLEVERSRPDGRPGSPSDWVGQE